nr:pentatricopeptide repeat-containing protein [Tanacetum cinerariifolium]
MRQFSELKPEWIVEIASLRKYWYHGISVVKLRKTPNSDNRKHEICVVKLLRFKQGIVAVAMKIESINEAALNKKCFMDWSWLPTDGSDRPNDIVFRVHYNGMFFFDPLGYNQGKVVEMDGFSKHRVMYTYLLNMLATKKWGKNIVATVIQDDVEGIDVIDVEDVFEVLDSIDVEVLAKQQKLDKGKGKLGEANIFTSKKWKPLQRGNGITIRENENPLPTDTDSSNSEDYNQSESEILETDKEECTQSLKFEDVFNNDVVLTPLVKEHERNMQSLLKKLKGNHMGITDPFAIVEKQNEKFPSYDQQTHWKLKKPKLGEKFPNITQFKECLTYYALANGFSL